MGTIMNPVSEHSKKYVDVLGKRMAYVEMGEGDPILFQHGNPTSSYLWRNIMPHLRGAGRCIAIDLIGMGDSDKLDDSGPNRYTFVEHRKYFDAALEALGINDKVTLVVHDWGSALGFDWANRHASRVKGICYMESIVWVLEKNVFVERVLPGSIIRKLSEEEMAVYRRPFAEPGEGRRPTLTWPRQLPIAGEPAEVVGIVQAYGDWLKVSDTPKLFINAEPGAILTGPQRDFCRSWPNQVEVTVKGIHFIQEDSPDEIGTAIADWLG